MNQRGVHSQVTTGGMDRDFTIKVSARPTVARNRTQTQWQPRRPNGKGFANIGPKFPFTVNEEGVVWRSRYLPGTMGPILVGKKCSTGQTRTPRRARPANMRSASRRSGGSRPLRLLAVSAQHVPPQSPRARSGRHTTPETQAGSPASRHRVGPGGGQPRAQIHME